MAGCSLSMTWLDDELEDLWRAPVDTPAFRRDSGAVAAPRPVTDDSPRHANRDRGTGTTGEKALSESGQRLSDEAQAAAEVVREALLAVSDIAMAHGDEWGRLDSVAGDGDHGVGMARGAQGAAAAATESVGGPRTVLQAASDAFADRAGGSSGALWGAFLGGIAGTLSDNSAPSAADVTAAMSAGADALQRLGKCEIGDKTMYDSLRPFADELSERVSAGESLSAAWSAAADLASERAAATADMMPRLGRARPLGKRSLGTPDPGATSMAECLGAVAAVLIAGADDSEG